MTFLYLLMFFLSIFFVYRINRTLFTPPSIMALTWCLFPAMASMGILGLYDISFTTHIYILFAYFSFIFGYIISTQRKRKLSSLYGYKQLPDDSIFIGKDYINYKLLIVLNILITLWLSTSLESTVLLVEERGFAYLRGVALSNFSESTIINILYGWIAKPFVVASCAILSIDVFERKGKNQLIFAVCVLLNVLLDTFVFAARATMVKLLFYLGLSFLFCKKKTLSHKQKFLAILIAILLLVVTVLLTGERMIGKYSDFSFFNSICMYYVAPFGLLNYYVENPDFSKLSLEGLTLGSAGFGFLYNIFRSFLYIVFRFPYNGSDYIVQLVTQQSVLVGTTVGINSGCTAAYIFLRDFAVLGLILGFFLMGVVISNCKFNFDFFPNVRSGAIYVFMLYVIFRLSMSYELLSPSFLFTLMFIILGTSKFPIKVKLK